MKIHKTGQIILFSQTALLNLHPESFLLYWMMFMTAMIHYIQELKEVDHQSNRPPLKIQQENGYITLKSLHIVPTVMLCAAQLWTPSAT